jgi:hypothetical protein
MSSSWTIREHTILLKPNLQTFLKPHFSRDVRAKKMDVGCHPEEKDLQSLLAEHSYEQCNYQNEANIQQR